MNEDQINNSDVEISHARYLGFVRATYTEIGEWLGEIYINLPRKRVELEPEQFEKAEAALEWIESLREEIHENLRSLKWSE